MNLLILSVPFSFAHAESVRKACHRGEFYNDVLAHCYQAKNASIVRACRRSDFIRPVMKQCFYAKSARVVKDCSSANLNISSAVLCLRSN